MTLIFLFFFALTSPPHASFSLRHSVSCADDVKRHSDIQQWRLKEWWNLNAVFVLSRTLSLSPFLTLSFFYFSGLFFHSLRSSLPLFLCRAVKAGCLCCRQLVLSILACPYISSGVFLPLHTRARLELSLAVWMCSDSCWQAQWRHYLSNQQPCRFSI